MNEVEAREALEVHLNRVIDDNPANDAKWSRCMDLLDTAIKAAKLVAHVEACGHWAYDCGQDGEFCTKAQQYIEGSEG